MNDIFADFRNAFRYPNNGLMKLIVINVLVFLVMAFLHVVFWLAKISGVTSIIIDWVAVSPDMMKFITRPWTIITYGFVHNLQDIFHILFNMLALYFMGRLVQDFAGSRRVISIYLLGVIAGALFFFAFHNFIPRLIEEKTLVRLVGASGGVYAIVVAAATLAPDAIVLLFGIFPVRLKYIALVTVFLSFLELASPNTGGNAAHLGGALIGYLFVKQLRRGNDLGRPINKFLEWWASLFEPKPTMKGVYVKEKVSIKASPNKAKQEKAEQSIASGAVPSQEEIDRILDKISENGYESLSKEEKQKLFNASRQD